MKRFFLILLLCLLLLTGCENTPGLETSPDPFSGNDFPELGGSTNNTPEISYDALPVDDMFSKRDYETTYKDSDCTLITLNGNFAQADSTAVSVSDGVVIISQEGSYLLRGELTEGMVIVDTDKKDKVQLILDGVSITSSTSAAIYVRQADKVFITLNDGSSNTLINGGAFINIDKNDIDSVIFSKDDLTINGNGSLTITSPAGHGIVSKDDLRITGGSYNISSAGHGLAGNDAVKIAGGNFILQTGKDGIQADNDEDTALGYVYISGGVYDITATQDGISASANLQIDDGRFHMLCGGGSQYGEEHTDDMFGGMGGGPGGMGGWPGQAGSEPDNTVSAKGLKSTGPMVLNGGSFTLNTADDAVHSNHDLTVTGGDFTIATGDDGFHADKALTIQNGTIQISESYEGLEGLSITVNGGTIRLKASDDGLNAAGGNDQSGFGGMGGRPGKPGGHGGFGGDQFGASSDSFITIAGGNLFVDADGDGIDSNGNLVFTGGYTVVEGPTNGGNAPLDYSGSGSFSGGTILVTGSSGMAQSLSSTGSQGLLAINVGSCPAGTRVVITDASGAEILSLQPQKQFGCVIVSCPEMTKGETYTFSIEGQSKDFTAQ